MDEAQKKREANQASSEALLQEVAASENEEIDTTSQDETAFRGEDFSGVEDRDTRRARILGDVAEHTINDPIVTGGDIDANLEQAEMSGEEAVGGTSPTPDQNNVDELAAAVGTEVLDQQDRYATDELNQRDSQRWELDPKSSEDYREHRD